MHDDILAATGGEPGILNRGPIEAAIARARWGPFAGEGDLAERAALLMRGIVSDHPFVDGNKRTAFEVADTFLERNGRPLEIGTDEGLALVVGLARGQVGITDLAERIEDHLTND